MPRVLVRTATRSGPAAPQTTRSATFFVVGQAERGGQWVPGAPGALTGAVELRSMQDYVDLAGPRVPYGAAYDALRTYFEEGGVHAYLARVVGAGATVGTRNLVDRAGAPVATLAIDAKDPGAWSANVTVEVAAGSVAGTFRLIIRYAGIGGSLLETYDNLDSVATAVAKLATSEYVRGRDLASPSGALAIPAVAAPQALSAGTDDRGTLLPASYTAALARFAKALGPGAVAIPGQTPANVGAALRDHGDANWRDALIGASQGATNNAAIAEAQALRAPQSARAAAIFHPWLLMPDDAGGTRQVDPVGFAAGVRARAIEEAPETVARAAAGEISSARFISGVVLEVDDNDADALDAGEVNSIRTIGGRVQMYGYRSLSLDEANYFLLKEWTVLAWACSEVETMLARYPFITIDAQGRAFSRIAGEAKGLLAPLADAGGLYPLIAADGEVLDRGYKVDLGPAVNTQATIAAQRLRVAVGVRPSPSAAMIEAVVTKAAVGAAL